MIKAINKKIIGYLWLAILGMGFLAYFLWPQIINISHLIILIKNHYWLTLIVFLVIICFRGLLLISPLSITLASTIFFPPLTVLLINSFGILISATLIYKFSEFLGFDEYFAQKYQKRIAPIKNGLDRKEVPIIAAWSFLPFFPTDLIIYVSATLKVSLWKCLVGVFVGTAIINAILIYSLNFFLPYNDIAAFNTPPQALTTNTVSITSTSTTNTPVDANALVNTQTASPSTLITKTPPENINQLTPPLADARARVTKKSFGIKISPTDSPVQPEKFSGYHTGVDFETWPSEADQDVVVSALCSGPLILKKYASGYGGVAVQKCNLNKQTVTIIYGHLKLASIKPALGDQLEAGENFAILGQGYSVETDGERKHLHLGIHKGVSISLLGYVSKSADLSAWLNVLDYLP